MKKNIHISLVILNMLFISILKAQPGSIDLSFDSGTGFNDAVQSVVIQPDGKIIVAGWFTSFNGNASKMIARLNSDGTIDTTFHVGTGFNGQVNATPVQSDGKIIVGGNFTSYNGVTRNRIARLNSDGSLDTTFNPGIGFNDDVWATSLQVDGKIIVGGFFSTFSGTSRKSIARLNINGTIDLSFNPGTGFNNVVNTTAVQADGKILAGGNFGLFNGNPVNTLTRLNSDGTLDTGFGELTAGFNNGVGFISIQNDNKLVITGDFSSFAGSARNKIARLNSDGTLDTTFNPGTGFNSFVLCNVIQNDGKIVVGGSYNFYNGISRNSIVRINTDGSIDNGFDPGTAFVNNVRWIGIQQDGKIVAGGAFTSYNGTAINRIIRLNNDLTVGASENFLPNSFTIYPNPNNGIGFITLNSTTQITISNLQGQIVLNQFLQKGTQELNLSGLSDGIYFIQAVSGKEKSFSKIIIDK